MEVLSKDTFDYLIRFLNNEEIIILSMVSKALNKKLDSKLHSLFHECTKEIEDKWNRFAKQMMEAQCKNFMKVCCQGCHNIKSEQIVCSVYPWRIHSLKVDYFHFPRDVNLLTWYFNGEEGGYTML